MAAVFLMAVFSAAAAADPLAGSEWRPVALNGEPLPEPHELFVRFEGAKRVFVNGGCNHFTGHYRLQGRELLLNTSARTRNACDDDRIALERALLDIVQMPHRFQRQRARLVFEDAHGVAVARFVQTDWD